MTQSTFDQPTFNLWEEAWITVERSDGGEETLNIPQTLTEAHRIRALYDPSPLVTVAIHRLLLAILQAVTHPQSIADLRRVWRAGQFSAEQLNAFAQQYAHRFDLFSPDAPFLQSANLPLQPAPKSNSKPVGSLFHEEPPGTTAYFYNHTLIQSQNYCSKCAAKGLVTIPTFTTTGGQGNRPSINGDSPIYVIPGGENLFQSLAGSLTIPKYQPPTFEPVDYDTPWWVREPIVVKKGIVEDMGYLHSLTLPVRRVRLHPVSNSQTLCTRCGEITPWHVMTMIYEMGESPPKDAIWWRDPFIAYRKPKDGKEEHPKTIRLTKSKALWREFGGLFLPSNEDYRPIIINLLERLRDVLPYGDTYIPLRIVGLYNDNMKIYRWQEGGFDIPPRLLSDEDTAKYIEKSIEFAQKCDDSIKRIFRQYFGGGSKKSKRFASVISQMSHRYWQELGLVFHTHIQQYTADADDAALFKDWLNQVFQKAMEVFAEAIKAVPTEGYLTKPDKVRAYKNVKSSRLSKLRLRQNALDECRKSLNVTRKKYLPQEETV